MELTKVSVILMGIKKQKTKKPKNLPYPLGDLERPIKALFTGILNMMPKKLKQR